MNFIKKYSNKAHDFSIPKYCFVLTVVLFILTGFNTKAQAANDAPYLIKVNKQQNCITIYEKDSEGEYTVPIKAMSCSTGYATPLGTYDTKIKYRWKLLIDDVWGQYATRIVGSILFHSVWYTHMDPNTLSYYQYNKLGTTASHGCIRLTVEDAKWIYDNCKIGTTVIIYNDSDPGPLGKPSTLKLTGSSGWDPTDPSKDNPYHTKKPTILGAKDLTIEYGAKVDLLKGLSAKSSLGNFITSSLAVSGVVDHQTPGDYKITYSVEDELGHKAEKKITVTVDIPKEIPLIAGVKDRIVSGDEIINEEFCLEGVTAYIDHVEISKDQIQVNIEEQENYYNVTYTVQLENGKMATEKATIYLDNESPVLKGVTHRIHTSKITMNRKYAMKGVSVSDNYSKLKKKDIKVKFKEVDYNTYLVTYTVYDDLGNCTEETVQFTHYDYVIIDGVKNHKVPAGTKITEQLVLEGVTGTDGTKDLTKNIEVTIKEIYDNQYKVTYELEDEYHSYVSVIAYYTVENE